MQTGSEIAYLRRRMRTSLIMAAAAAGPCAQIAHRTLAQLYEEAIETLSGQNLRKKRQVEDPMLASSQQEAFRHTGFSKDVPSTMALA